MKFTSPYTGEEIGTDDNVTPSTSESLPTAGAVDLGPDTAAALRRLREDSTVADQSGKFTLGAQEDVLAMGTRIAHDQEIGAFDPTNINEYLNVVPNRRELSQEARQRDVETAKQHLQTMTNAAIAQGTPREVVELLPRVHDFLRKRVYDEQDRFAHDAYSVLSSKPETVELASTMHAIMKQRNARFEGQTDPSLTGDATSSRDIDNKMIYDAMTEAFGMRASQRATAAVFKQKFGNDIQSGKLNLAEGIKTEDGTTLKGEAALKHLYKQAAKEVGGIEPDDIVFDLTLAALTGGLSGLRRPVVGMFTKRMLTKELGSLAAADATGAAAKTLAMQPTYNQLVSEAVKGTTASIATEMAWTTVATGAFTMAEKLDHGATWQVVEATLGTALAGALSTTAVTALPKFFRNIRSTNPAEYKSLYTMVHAGKLDPMKERLQRAMANVDEVTEQILPWEQDSPFNKWLGIARTTGDAGAQEQAVNAVLLSLTRPESKFGQSVNRAIGAGEYAWAAPLLNGDTALTSAVVPTTDLATKLAKATQLGVAGGNHMLVQSLGLETAARTSSKLAQFSIIKDKYNFGTAIRDWGEGGVLRNPIARFLSSGKGLFKDARQAADLVEVPTFLQGQNARLNNFLRDAYSDIFHGLDDVSRGQFDDVLTHVRDKGITDYQYTSGGIIIDGTHLPMKRKALDALVSYNMVNEFTHKLMNETARSQAGMRGFKMLDDSVLVNPIKARDETQFRTKIKTEEGAVRVRSVEPQLLEDGKMGYREWVVPANEATRLRNLKDTDVIIPKEKIYVRREIADDYRTFKIQQKSDGTVNTVLIKSHPRQHEAEKFVAEQMATASDGELYMTFRRGEEQAAFSAGPTVFNELYKLSPAQLTSLTNSLKRGGIDPKHVEDIAGYIAQNAYDRKSFLLEKNSRIQKGVNYLPANEAWAKALTAQSRYISIGEHAETLRQTFRARYGKFLSDPNDMWSPLVKVSEIKPQYGSNWEARRMLIEARETRDKIRQIIGRPTESFLRLEASVQAAADHIRSHGWEQTGNLLEKAILDWPQQGAKKLGTTLAFAFSTAQVGLQMLGPLLHVTAKYATADTGRNPAILGTLDFFRSQIGGRVSQRLGRGMTTEAAVFKDMLDRSGFLATINMHDLSDTADIITGLNRWQTRTWDTAKLPYRLGEAFGRGMAWSAAYHEVLADTMQMAGLKYGVKPDEIGKSFNFFTKVNGLASDIAINMNALNQPKYSRTFLVGQALQFTEFMTHQAELMMWGKQFTRAEKMRVWAAMVATFGLKGVPFLTDAVAIGEAIVGKEGATDKYLRELAVTAAENAQRSGKDKVTARRLKNLADGGLPKAMTGGKVDIASRMVIGGAVIPYVDGLDYSDLFGPGLKLAAQFAGGQIQTVKDLYHFFTLSDKPLEEISAAKFRLIRQITSGVPGAQAIVRAAESDLRDKYVDNRGNIVLDESPTLLDKIQMGLGFTPGKVYDVKQTQSTLYKWGKAVKEAVRTTAKDHAKMYQTNPDVAMKMFEKSLRDTGDTVGPQYVQQMLKDFIHETQRLQMSAEQQLIHRDFMTNLYLPKDSED